MSRHWTKGSAAVEVAALQDVDVAKAKYFGTDFCKTCHEKPQPQFKTDHVLLTEYTTWKEKDKHSQAYEALSGERGQMMGALLKIDPVKDNRCLSCHAMNFPENRRADSFRLQDGVSCDGCHGPAEHWLIPHSQRAWRDKPAEDKTKLGLVDMRNPVRRAEMCLSCHIGNVAEGKVLTHAMYAAGHPPLPGFEMDTFCDNLPNHWRYLKDKAPEIREKFGHDGKELSRVRNVVVSGVVAARQNMKLVDAQIASKAWPDYANFDCASCHHELRRPSWRQESGYRGVPGRPPAPFWPNALVKLGIASAAADETQHKTLLAEFEQKLEKLQGAFARRAFGDATAIAGAAKELSDWTDNLLAKIQARKIDRASAERLLLHIAAIMRSDRVDCESARQLAWAWRSIYAQLDPKPKRDADIQTMLGSLDKELNLALPSGTQRKIMAALPERLQAQERYDPEKLRKLLDEMNVLLRSK